MRPGAGRPVLAPGTPARFAVARRRPGEDVPVGGTLWQSVAAAPPPPEGS